VKGSHKIAVTGVTSFTGVELANFFSQAGNEVHAAITDRVKSYTGLKADRLRYLSTGIKVTEFVRSNDNSILDWIEFIKPDIWIHHYHFMQNWRGPTFDLVEAKKQTIDPLSGIVKMLKLAGCKTIIYSSTYLEPEHDFGDEYNRASPYVKSKILTRKELSRLANQSGISLGTIALPNVFGPRENADRLIPSLMRQSYIDLPYEINSPTYIMRNITPNELCRHFQKVILRTDIESDFISKPATIDIPVLDFANLINKELLVKRLGWRPCQIRYNEKITRPTYCITDFDFKCLDEILDQYASWVLDQGEKLWQLLRI
jgi:nucleoside-diphosphate-sugar epimerase